MTDVGGEEEIRTLARRKPATAFRGIKNGVEGLITSHKSLYCYASKPHEIRIFMLLVIISYFAPNQLAVEFDNKFIT